MRSHTLWLCLGIAILGCTGTGDFPLASQVADSTSRIVDVTVFPDRAEIVREARVDLPTGSSTIQFPDLPYGVEPDSLRVTARGVPATLGIVEMRQRAEEPKQSPELVAARNEVSRLEMEIQALAAEQATSKDLREFLAALRSTTVQRESEKLGEGRTDPAALQATYALIRTSLQELAREDLARMEKLRKMEKELEVARAKLAATRPAGGIRSRIATVEVETKQPGSLTLRLAYVAPGASWRPAYRASLDAGTGEISLASEAVVVQRTGEDWSGVALRLSTASPARGVNPPQLASWLLRPLELLAEMKDGDGFGRVNASAKQAGEKVYRRDSAQPEVTGLEILGANSLDEASARREAAIVHSSYNVAFEVPGRADIPADGTDHRVGLRQDVLPGEVQYKSVPSLNPAAFLIARTKAPVSYPLLAGPVRVFAGGAYLGAFPLPETPPEADLELPFGVDNRVRVERSPLPQSRTQEGFIGKERKVAYAFRTTIENLRDQKAVIVVEERIPVSEDERIVVEMEKGTTPGAAQTKNRPGVLQWTVTLDPKQKRELVLEYTVRMPKGMVVPGIE